MVAHQGYDPATGLRRFLFQGNQQVQDFARFWTSVNQIAHLDESGLATSPMVLLVYEASPLQDSNEVVEVPVNIADGYQ